MKVLFVNCCIRDKDSRTLILSTAFLKKLKSKYPNAYIKEVTLYKENLKPFLYDDIKYRDSLIENGNFDDEIFKYSKDALDSNIVVIASPYWDLSFPSLLKCYIEHLFVNNLTFKYEGTKAIGLSSISKVILLSTSGGLMNDKHLSYLYDAFSFISSKDIRKYHQYVEFLDVLNKNDSIKVLDKATNELDEIIKDL